MKRRARSILAQALFIVWCALPFILVRPAIHSDSWIAIVGLIFAVLTPVTIHAWGTSRVQAEKRAHARCHADVLEMLDSVSTLHAFNTRESMAIELEILEDQLRRLPPKTLIHAHSLANGIAERAQRLRQSSPDPPDLDLAELVKPDETEGG